MPNKITKKEIKDKAGYIALAFFTWYLIEPVKTWVNNHLYISPFLIGIIGIAAVLYWFDF